MRFTFSGPRRADLLYVDVNGAADLRDMALSGIDAEVLPVRREAVYLSPRILLATLANLGRTGRSHLGLVRGLPGRLYRAHLLACVQRVAPKVVVTYIDNSYVFQWLTGVYPSARYVAVQNGLRYPKNVSAFLPPAPQPGSTIQLEDFLCFGEYERELYERFSHDVVRFHPCGSLRGAYYRSVVAPKRPDKRYDLCVVSEWEPQFMEGESAYPQITRGLILMNEMLGRFAADRPGLRVVVAPRSTLPAERAYYRALFGERAEIIEPDFANWSTYRAMDASHVSISFASTATTEVFGWGGRSLAVNLSGDVDYDFPVAGPWSFTDGAYEDFAKQLDGLLAMTDTEFAEASADAARYVMAYDFTNPPNELLRSLVTDALSGRDAGAAGVPSAATTDDVTEQS